ncbi:hypothetical protein SAMN04488568_11457 [Maricaulis salignorans]|uniref:Uncharacterized protein n=2 Tax=Maricaulis salignorans TaxID=144026 RepID=A0A1G9UA09_9PROT|nr:hypothetical protein SAMN04488568_11457 [Maricaulis salignorans]
MPLQNRVTPLGAIVSHEARGQLMGNRGCLHNDQQQLVDRRWTRPAWVTCSLVSNSGNKRKLMTPGKYTELFFTDEATSFAAGHRPCRQCRYDAYTRFQKAFGKAFPEHGERPSAVSMDKALHASRIERHSKQQITFEADLHSLPVGTFFVASGLPRPIQKFSDGYKVWSFDGYAQIELESDQLVTVLTPYPSVQAFKAGYFVGP